MPALSIIVPYRNVETDLERCLASIQSQTFQDFEVICVNDGSDDFSRSIVQRFQDSDDRFQAIDHEAQGLGESANIGLAMAQGEYASILQPCECLKDDALAVLFSAARSHNAEVSIGSFIRSWEEPHRGEAICRPPIDCDTVVDPKNYQDLFFAKILPSSFIFRLSFLRDNHIGFFQSTVDSLPDTSFVFETLAAARTALFSNQVIVEHKTVFGDGSTDVSIADAFAICDEYREMERFLRARPLVRRELEAVKNRMKFDSYLWNYDHLPDQSKTAFLNRVSGELKADIDARTVDFKMFSASDEALCRAMATNREGFAASRAHQTKQNAGSRLARYIQVGGLPLAMKSITSRIERKSRGFSRRWRS